MQVVLCTSRWEAIHGPFLRRRLGRQLLLHWRRLLSKKEYAPAYLFLYEGQVCVVSSFSIKKKKTQHLHSALFSSDFLCVPALGDLASNWLCKNILNLACRWYLCYLGGHRPSLCSHLLAFIVSPILLLFCLVSLWKNELTGLERRCNSTRVGWNSGMRKGRAAGLSNDYFLIRKDRWALGQLE